ncbi:MAG: ECF transporter S component [Candidatus Bathyarchaeota archaeon]|nr:ECF transporter S component [Candidatus Bathyarchaeota archaeon]
MKIKTQQVALMAVFAALFYVLSLIAPIRIPTGIGTIEIGFAALIASVFGIILGPYLGAAAALLGSSVTWALTGMSPYGAPFILAPMFNALIVGLIFYKKWKYALVTFAVMVTAFLFTPPVSPITGQTVLGGLAVNNWFMAAATLFDKVIAILLILPLAFFGKKMSIAYGSAFFFILGFIGNEADNMFGTLMYVTPPVYSGVFGMSLEAVQVGLIASPFLYPAVRIIQAVIVMLVAVPLLSVLKKTNWLWSKDNILTSEAPKIQAA